MAGIETRHARSCRSRAGSRCNCTPTYQAHVFDARTGRRLRKTFPTHAAAKAWRQDSAVALREGRMRAPTGETLDQAAGVWVEGARAGAVHNRSGDPYKPSAIRAYEQNLRLRVLPALGRKRLHEIRRADLQALVDELVSEGTSPAVVMTTLLPLRAIFRRAVARGDLGVNPTSGLEMPAVRSRRDRIVSPADAERLLAALDPEDRPLWATALYAGLRRGELVALRWEDVSLAEGTIRVERGWDAIEGEIAPKSREGRRKVPVHAGLRDHLLDQRMSRADDAVRVFGSLSQVRRQAERAQERWRGAGLEPLTLHEGRHTYASFMIAAGVNAKALSTFMGHANIAITLDLYGHLMPGSQAEAASLLEGYLARAGGQATVLAEGATVAQSVAHPSLAQ